MPAPGERRRGGGRGPSRSTAAGRPSLSGNVISRAMSWCSRHPRGWNVGSSFGSGFVATSSDRCTLLLDATEVPPLPATETCSFIGISGGATRAHDPARGERRAIPIAGNRTAPGQRAARRPSDRQSEGGLAAAVRRLRRAAPPAWRRARGKERRGGAIPGLRRAAPRGRPGSRGPRRPPSPRNGCSR